MSLVERCWMITSKFSVIAILIITGICFGVFVYPYMKKKISAYMLGIVQPKIVYGVHSSTENLLIN